MTPEEATQIGANQRAEQTIRMLMHALPPGDRPLYVGHHNSTIHALRLATASVTRADGTGRA